MTKLTVYAKRPVNLLKGLQECWENARPIRHAQATGMILHQMYVAPQWTVDIFLPLILRFIERHGPYGIDGILLTAMGLANKMKSQTYLQAIDTVDLMTGELTKLNKPSFGIYFADFEVIFPSNLANGSLLPIQKIILSAFDDTFRNQLFDGAFSGLGLFNNNLSTNSLGSKDFGASVRFMGGQLPLLPNSMISENGEHCVQGWAVAGGWMGAAVLGIAGGVAGSMAAPGPGTVAGAAGGASSGGFLGFQTGKYVGMVVCGASASNREDNTDSSPTTDGTQTDTGNSQTGTGDSKSSNDSQTSNSNEPDNSSEQSGMCTDPDDQTSIIVPEMEPTSNDAGVFVLAAMGLADPAGNLNFPDQSLISNPVQSVEGLGGGKLLITYNPNTLISLFTEETTTQNQVINDNDLLKIAFRIGSLIYPVFNE